jgi:hypothetical protein
VVVKYCRYRLPQKGTIKKKGRERAAGDTRDLSKSIISTVLAIQMHEKVRSRMTFNETNSDGMLF